MSGRLENSKARNIRLVGLDLDGTVFTDEKTITPATKDAIARAVRAGVAVLPVTGRPRSGLPEEVLAIPGVRYAITSNGRHVRGPCRRQRTGAPRHGRRDGAARTAYCRKV